MNGCNRSVKPWSPSAVRGRRSEQNRRIACDCRHLQPRPGPSHHGLTEQLRMDASIVQSLRIDSARNRRTSGVEATVLQVPVVARVRAVACCFSAARVRCPYVGLLAGSMAFPRGITVERATSPQGGQRVSLGLSPFDPPRAAPAAKTGGALSPPAALPCGAPPRRVGGGHARRRLASLSRSGRGKSVFSRVQCGVSGKSHTTTARGPPSEKEALCVSRSCPP